MFYLKRKENTCLLTIKMTEKKKQKKKQTVHLHFFGTYMNIFNFSI